jgi:hypothetical protein
MDEGETGSHDGLGVICSTDSNVPRLPSHHGLFLSASDQFVKGALKGAVVDLLAGMRFFNSFQSILSGDTSMALSVISNRCRQIESLALFCHMHIPFE